MKSWLIVATLVVGASIFGWNQPANAVIIPFGPQNDIAINTVHNVWGWTPCYQSAYNQQGGSIAAALGGCQGDNLMMAAIAPGSTNYDLLAAAPRFEVITNTGDNNDVTHLANGSEWYFSTGWSWGFAAGGDVVNRNTCDIGVAANADQRLCWHTGGGNISTGFRSGVNEYLQSQAGWQRVLLVANNEVPEPATLALFGLGLLGLGAARRQTKRNVT